MNALVQPVRRPGRAVARIRTSADGSPHAIDLDRQVHGAPERPVRPAIKTLALAEAPQNGCDRRMMSAGIRAAKLIFREEPSFKLNSEDSPQVRLCGRFGPTSF